MSTTEDLIASLCAEGRVDSTGGFTLDREKAREKLRTFQIAEPHRYVLHLVALAVLRRASAIEVTIDTDDVRVRFDGEPLTRVDFEDLYSSSVAEPRDDADRARQQLAVGLNAALALNPRFIRVVSGAGEARLRLIARHGAEDVIEVADEPGSGTEIHVKQRFRPGLVVRFLRHVRGDMPEATALRERCAYAPVPLRLGDEELARGLMLREYGLRWSALVEEEGRSCVAALSPDPDEPAEVRLVRHGVWISSLRAAHLPGGLLAVVRDDALQTDLSAQEVVQGPALARCMALVERAAEQVVLGRIAESERAGLSPEDRASLRPLWERWPRALDAATPLGRAMAALPWWSDIFGRPVSLADLRAAFAQQGALGYTNAEFVGRLAEHPHRVVCVLPDAKGEPGADLLLLRRIFGDGLRDRTRELELLVRREANRRRWLARPASPTLEGEPLLARAPVRVRLHDRDLVGEVGLRIAGGPSALRLLADGHLLAEAALELPLPVDAVLAGVTPNADFDGAARDAAYTLGGLGLLDAALAAAEAYLSEKTASELSAADRALARRYLALRYDPEGPGRWAQALGVRASAKLPLDEAARAGLTRICREHAGVPLATVMEAWLGELASLPTASGRDLSLAAVALAIERAGAVAWTRARVEPSPGLDRIVLLLHGDELALAQLVFGSRLREIPADELKLLLARHRFDAQPEEEVSLPAAQCFAQVRVTHGRLEAVLAFTYAADARPQRAAVRVLVEGRFVCEREIWMPLSHVRVVLRDDRLRPRADYREIVDDRAWKDACRTLQQSAPRLAAELVQAARAGEAAPPILLAHVLTASFPTRTLRSLWDRLAAAEDPTQAEISYERVLALAVDVAPDRLDQALRDAMREPPRRRKKRTIDRVTEIARIADRVGGKIDVDRGRFVGQVLRDIRAACGQTGEGTLAQRVAAAAADLTAQLRYTRVDGSPTSLAELQAARSRGEALALASDPPPALLGGRQPPHAVVVDAEDEALLVCMFGEAALSWPLQPTPAPTPKPASPRAWPQPEGPVLARVEVEDPHVRGVLWISPRRRSPDRLVALLRGEHLYARVELPHGLVAGGALAGQGVSVDAGQMAWTEAARRALMPALLELHERLLRTSGPDTTEVVRWALERLRDQGNTLLGELHPLRERLRGHLQESHGPAAPTETESAQREAFGQLEAEARARAKQPEGPRAPAPKPVEAAAPPPPEVQLLEAVRAELKALRELHDGLLSDFNLAHLRLSQRRGEPPVWIASEAVVVSASHPLIREAAAEFSRDRTWVDFIASLVFTAFNEWRHEISDADEQEFHRLHLARLNRRLAGSR